MVPESLAVGDTNRRSFRYFSFSAGNSERHAPAQSELVSHSSAVGIGIFHSGKQSRAGREKLDPDTTLAHSGIDLREFGYLLLLHLFDA